MRTKPRLWPWITLAVILLLLFFHTAVLGAFGGFLVRDDAPRHGDAILVLAGDATGNRILKAAQMVREGYALKAIVSGPPVYSVHESDLAIAMAEKAGYPPVFFQAFENNAHSTKEEARAAAPVLRGLHARHVIIVTSDFHTRRAGNIFRSEIPDIQFDVAAAPDQDFTANGWWKNREGRKTFVLEWVKTVSGWFGM